MDYYSLARVDPNMEENTYYPLWVNCVFENQCLLTIPNPSGHFFSIQGLVSVGNYFARVGAEWLSNQISNFLMKMYKS